MTFLASGVVLLLALLGLSALLWVIGKLRVPCESCPRCAHAVVGLTDPRCPECGEDLAEGVVGTGGLRPAARHRIAIVAVTLGVVCGGLLLGIFGDRWNQVLNAAGLMDQRIDIRRETTLGVAPQPQIMVGTDVDFLRSEVDTSTGEVIVVVRDGGRDVAAWRGRGPIRIQAGALPKIEIDPVAVLDELRSQLSTTSDSEAAAIVRDESIGPILAAAIASYATYEGSPSGHVVRPDGRKIFQGIGVSQTGARQSVRPSLIWYAPIYVVPATIFALCLWTALRVLIRNHRLRSFQPAGRSA